MNLNLGITAPALGRPPRLRADEIRVQDLLQLGRILAEGDDRARLLIDALEDLGRLAGADRRDGELDAALDDVAALAGLHGAEMDLTPGDVEQLAEQAAAAVAPVLRPVAGRAAVRPGRSAA
jgi:hypothetical protein